VRLLHAGCGHTELPEWLASFEETRLDIDPSVGPHVVASMTAMGEVGQFEAVYSCHAVEHLDAAGVRAAFAEFLRVLKPGGLAVVIVPDLEGIEDNDRVLYESPAGPITGRDMIHGHAGLVAENPHMAHRSGFTSDTLAKAMYEASFTDVKTCRYPAYNLMAMGRKETA
jgi:SAM-dependent methyltransferase